LTDVMWGNRPPPALEGGAVLDGRWTPGSAAELTRCRRRLAAALAAEQAAGTVAGGAVERLLLVFEEIGSNALRHGRGPVEITLTRTPTHWLLEVSDAAGDRPPTPAVGRDPVHGGLGLHLVARLCTAHGWILQNGRKHVWAHVAPTADVDTTADAG
jgi:hypothetical protein